MHDYLRSPPNIRQFTELVRPVFGWWPLLNANDMKTAVRTAEVQYADGTKFVMGETAGDSDMTDSGMNATR